ncbi:MAG: DEAD/DEAH box helicase [Deltaproteobacteria bacterium]|nr:DEAD/DEAH box helicase [Deltaproteobacteria bacterium]
MTISEFIAEIKKRKDLKDVAYHEVFPMCSASYADSAKKTDKRIEKALNTLGIKKLYTHQAEAISSIRGGSNTVVMTPTASGKSLIYNIPVIENALKDNASRALYLFPLKGLEQDQLKNLNAMFAEIGDKGLSAAIYDGDTTDYNRKKIRSKPPTVLFTNPDMLHLGILAFHAKWESFFQNLRYVVIDEIHAYRGVLGSHVAQLLRRLRRICSKYGSNPVFIASSATIANPGELATMLTGLPFTVTDENGAPSGRKHFLLIDPAKDLSPYTIATKIFTESIENGFKAICFTKARKITELMHTWVKEGSPKLSPLISSYRAGYLPEERREIERRLFSGELSGVITTSALELGVDIGGLDVCVLAGYPGSISSTWQRAGRVGRGTKDSLVVMVALEDALDKYFMRSGEEFFNKSAEAATLDAANPVILKSHLACAAAEMPVRSAEAEYAENEDSVETALSELVAEKKLWKSAVKRTYNPRSRYPHREVSIRGTGAPFRILKEINLKPIAESGTSRVMRELHPGAIYMHRGEQYLITSLHLSDKEATARPVSVNYYTSAITDEETEILSEKKVMSSFGSEMSIGRLRITETVLGFRRKELYTRKVIEELGLELPPTVFTTEGMWFIVSDELINAISAKKFSIPGSLHALEHALIAALPLFALCDRNDLGGRSYTLNPALGAPSIFVYDAHEGGVGLAKKGFELAEDWFMSTRKMLSECPCEVSCPSCTQDPHCGNNNEPLDKRGAILILNAFLG